MKFSAIQKSKKWKISFVLIFFAFILCSFLNKEVVLQKSEPYVVRVMLGRCISIENISCYKNLAPKGNKKFILCELLVDSVLFQQDTTVYRNEMAIRSVKMAIVHKDIYNANKDLVLTFSATNSWSKNALILVEKISSYDFDTISFYSKNQIYFSGLLECKNQIPFSSYLTGE